MSDERRETETSSSSEGNASWRMVSLLSPVALSIGAAGLAWVGPQLSHSMLPILYAALFVPYAVLLVALYRSKVPGPLVLGMIAVAAIGVRLLLLPAEPLLSDDIFRYVWDGRVGLSGVNPFRHPPAAEALAHLRDDVIWPAINHPDVPTIYPPGAQYCFELNALVGGGVVGMKAIFIGLEGACLALCGHLLATGANAWPRRRLVAAFALYALNPLVFVEVAWSGHVDVVAWALLATGVVLWCRRRGWGGAIGAGLLIGTSIAVKFLSLLALPLLLTGDVDGSGDGRSLRRRLVVVALAPLVTLMAYLPFLSAGSDLFDGFGTYAQSWRGNDGAYRVVYRGSRYALREWGRAEQAGDESDVLFRFQQYDDLFTRMGWTREWKGRTIPATTFTAGQLASYVARGIAGMIVLLVLSFCMATRLDPVRSTAWVLLALYGFAPIVHPWYVAWLIPLAALRWHWSSLAFSWAVPVAYLAWVSSQQGGGWHVPDWAVALEYGTVAIASVADVAFADIAPWRRGTAPDET